MSQSPGRLLPGDHVLSSGRPLSQGRNGHRDSLPSPPGSGFQIHPQPDLPVVSEPKVPPTFLHGVRKDHYTPSDIVNTRAKLLNEMPAHQTQRFHDQAEFIPGMQAWLNIQKSVRAISQINRLKKKSHGITSVHAEQHLTECNPIQDKSSHGNGKRKGLPKCDKQHVQNPTGSP